MFPDDTNISISGSDYYMIVKTLNDEMKQVDKWLKVNISKTHFIIFKGNKTVNYFRKTSVDNKYITQVNCTKFLDIMIDAKLTRKHNIEYM